MLPCLVLLASSFGLSVILTPIARALAARWGLVDHPDGRRKMHAKAIPLAGGPVILIASAALVTAAFLVSDVWHDRIASQGPTLLGLLLAGVVICLVGMADDRWGLRGRHKILGQLVAIGMVMSCGLLVRNLQIFQWNIELGLLAYPFTLFWLLGAINSLNLIDGMDGLLSSVGLIITLAIASMAGLGEQWATACVALALAGALLGFLCYNFPPASIFLGDSGSMLIGLVVGVLAIHSSLKAPATIALAAPLAIFTIPIFDTAAAIIRRKLTGRSIYTTDRGHLHHCLLRRGLSSRRVLLWISFFCFLTVVGALASLLLKNELIAIIAAAAVVCILIVTRLFGYGEFLLLKKRSLALAHSFLQGRANGKASQMEVRLQGSADWKGLWDALTACAIELNLKTLCLDVNAPAIHEGYHARWDSVDYEVDDPNLWRAEIPLAIQGQTFGRLQIMGQRDHEPAVMKIAIVTKLVEDFESTATCLDGTAVPLPAAVGGNGQVAKVE